MLFFFYFFITDQLKSKEKKVEIGTTHENPIPDCNIDVFEHLDDYDIESVPIEIFDDYPFLRTFLENPSSRDENGLTLQGNVDIYSSGCKCAYVFLAVK